LLSASDELLRETGQPHHVGRSHNERSQGCDCAPLPQTSYVDQGDILYQIHALASQSAVEMWLQNAINVLGNRYDSAPTHWMSLQHGRNLRSRKK